MPMIRRAARARSISRGAQCTPGWTVQPDLVAPPVRGGQLPELVRKPRAVATRLRTGSVMKLPRAGRRWGPDARGVNGYRPARQAGRQVTAVPDGAARGDLRRPAGRFSRAPTTAPIRSAQEQAPGSSRLTLAAPRSAARPCFASMCVVACRPCAAAATMRPPSWSGAPLGDQAPHAWATGISTSSRVLSPLRARLWPGRRRRPARSMADQLGGSALRPGRLGHAGEQGAVVRAAGTAGLALEHRRRLAAAPSPRGSAASRACRRDRREPPGEVGAVIAVADRLVERVELGGMALDRARASRR